jgi:hypothetical protein
LRHHSLAGTFAVLAATIAVAGCGGGSDSPTKAEFLKQGNAICKKGSQEIDAGAKKVFTSKSKPTEAQIEKFVTTTIIPSVQGQIDDLKAIGTPDGEEAKVDAIVSSAQSALDEGKKDPSLFASNKNDPFKKANQLAESYGLKECGGS